jgi:2-hydroxychromene-2-carboxylate isomerase
MSTLKNKKTWKIFWDLQCPYCRIHWLHHPAIVERFSTDYDFTIHLTSLAFHPQAFPAQAAANLIDGIKGTDAKLAFINACFENQAMYMNAALGDAKPSQVAEVFSSIAAKAGVLDDNSDNADNADSSRLTSDFFLQHLNDWELAVKPAYTEHKIALSHGVYGTPSHVIDGKLVVGSESSWGPHEWAEKLKSL